MKRKSFFFLTISICLIASVIAGLNWKRNRIQLFPNSVMTRNEIQKFVAIGSNIKTAHGVMQNNGFRCTFHPKGKWDGFGNGMKNNVMYCYKTSGFSLFNSSSYTIGIIYRSNNVTDIKVYIPLKRTSPNY